MSRESKVTMRLCNMHDSVACSAKKEILGR